MFIYLLSLAALLIAGSTAYFSTLGIATLFSGKYLPVLIMAGCLEYGKLIATSFLYRYWRKIPFFLKIYVTAAVITLMGITSMGVYGYLSSAYQVNASKNTLTESKINLIQQQKTSLDKEIENITSRITTLNQSRISQEKRLTDGARSTTRIYADIKSSQEEIRGLNTRLQELQKLKFDKDNELITLNTESSQANDIGTFKFVAQALNKPTDEVVRMFILILVCVLDPFAVALVLSYNIAVSKKVIEVTEEPVKEDKKPALITATGKIVRG
jgi:hypothetical protein